jgi:hypothetical protein
MIWAKAKKWCAAYVSTKDQQSFGSNKMEDIGVVYRVILAFYGDRIVFPPRKMWLAYNE